MKKRSILKKPQAVILALTMSISLLAACADPAEKPADDKTAEDLSMKDSDAASSNAADDSSDAGVPDSPGEAADEADSSASPGEDDSDTWNTDSENAVIVTQGNCEFIAFLSKDGKESWIYKVIIHKDGLKKLKFPAKVNDAPVTRIGYGEELYEEEADWYYTIFDNTLEPWHGGYDTDRKADSITTIEFPATLTRIEIGAFCGFKKLKKVEIPNGVKELTPYSFAACPKLTEVKLPAGLTTLDFKAFDKSKA
ncbi:MAG: leucine-rich repeat domain-containing protein, partial [Lachnospiraceae bacterium]|nr:leucine-rich repeat domain-containing protein [Lachnospiraceae bacterium]